MLGVGVWFSEPAITRCVKIVIAIMNKAKVASKIKRMTPEFETGK